MIKHCIVCLGLFSTAALAGDHSAYEPVVPIDNEPSHHLVLNSASIRVFDVLFPAEKQSLWHMHNKDSVLLCLDGADVPSEEPGVEPVKRPPIPSGLIYYREYASKPFVHRIRNAGKTDFRILDIEVLKERSAAMELAALGNGFSTVIENDRVRVSKALVKPDASLESLNFKGPHLLVSTTEGKFKIESPGQPAVEVSAARGSLRVEEKGRQASIRNIGPQDLEIVVVEVK